MDAIMQYKSGMLEFDITQSLLGRYIGMEPSRVSRGLPGELPFDLSESKSIEETTAAMRSVQAEMPLPINWAQFGKCKPHVDARRKQLRDQVDPMMSKYCVLRLGMNFFYRITSGEIITRPDQVSCATFEDPALANQAASELFKLGRKADVQIVQLMRRRSETVQSLKEIGFTQEKEQNNG